MPLYLPANFISTRVIETHGLRYCIMIGSLLMLFGSSIRLFALFGSFYPVFFGHILSLSGQAFLKNPVSKLATNWFGDKERGLATGIGIMSGPSGILISKILIMSTMKDTDILVENRDVARQHYELFIILNAIIVTIMVVPSLFLIKDQPPSPPSIVATKPRPNYTFMEAARVIFTNSNYLWIFIHFQLVNTVSIYGGEITTFLSPYPQYHLLEQNLASMLNCIASIAGSLYLGKIIDKYRCMKKAAFIQPIVISGFIVLTYILLIYESPVYLVIAVIVLAGAPISTVSVVSYQFVAEVTYPVNEVFGAGIMNTVNKLFTFIVVLISSSIGPNSALIFWAILCIFGVIPAFFVKEDFKRLNMKEVK